MRLEDGPKFSAFWKIYFLPQPLLGGVKVIKEMTNELDTIISEIEKDFGKGTLMRLGGSRVNREIEVMPTGISSIDGITDIGGFPRGRIVELIGPEASGKTALTWYMAKHVQKMGGVVSFITSRNGPDLDWAKAAGLNAADLLVFQLHTKEDFAKTVSQLVKNKKVDLIILDTFPDIVSSNNIESESEYIAYEAEGRKLIYSIRKLAESLQNSMTTVIFKNCEKTNIDNHEFTPLKTAMKAYSSMRIKLRTIDNIRKGEEIVGRKIRAKIIKNKYAPPFREAEFSIYNEECISMYN